MTVSNSNSLDQGAIGEFAIGEFSQGTQQAIFPGSWFVPLSEPVRLKPGLAAAAQQFLAQADPLPFVSFSWFAELSKPPVLMRPGLLAAEQQTLAYQPNPLTVTPFAWYANLSEPVRLKRGLLASEQSYFAYSPNPTTITPFAWYANLSEPVRLKPGLAAPLQQFFTTDTSVIPLSKLMEWFAGLSEPVRLKPGLAASLQQFLAWPSQLRPTPTTFGVLKALETKDVLLAGVMEWNTVTSAEIGVIEANFTGAEIGVSRVPAITSARIGISII